MAQAAPRRDAGRSDFWGEIAPCDHLLHVYDNDTVFLDSLEGFVAAGLAAGESAIVIATAEHGRALNDRLRARRIDVQAAKDSDQFILLNAEEVLAEFMRNDWPDDDAFEYVIGGVLERARKGGRKVRAFGEMVAVLWARGHAAATVRLEYLWNKYREADRFPLFCAYPRAGFTRSAADSLTTICEMHSRIFEPA